jgi:hypothetical protein
MKAITTFFIILSTMIQLHAAPQSDELVVLHHVTTAEMNAISSPSEGSLIFNTDDHEVYERNAIAWNRISSDGSETKAVAGNGITITGSGTTSDPYIISVATEQDCANGTQPALASCSAAPLNSDGIYCIDHDGAGGDAPYHVYCDMTTDGGGWSRVVRTTGNNHEFGQKDDTVAYAPATDSTGIYATYEKIKNFSKVMIKKVGTADYASYNLVSASGGDSIHDLMTYCKGQPEHHSDDAAWDGSRLKGMTSEYSGTKSSGTFAYSYFFMCGVNESYDNDQAYMSFSDSTGSSNSWGDQWRGTNQVGTLWSLLNNDYYVSGNTHIGNGQSQAGAGYKGSNDGTYEIYIK